jgi:hypothetical protein
MSNIDTNAQKKMQEELDKYLTHKEKPKSFFLFIKEITTWLQERMK